VVLVSLSEFGSAVKYLNTANQPVAIGLAHGPGITEYIAAYPELVDYVEIPFEQLRHAPQVGSIQEQIPVVLHCASMSVAGFVPPADATLDAIAIEAKRTRTPWIGEHLAFVTADPLASDTESDSDKSPTALTYTVCPQLSEETVERVAENLATLETRFDEPIILENSPQYFAVPGSTMSMVDFIGAVLQSSNAGLLLDLTHFLITMLNTDKDALTEIAKLPLERVVEIHISGLNMQSGIAWDDHATPAPAPVFELLDHVLERVRPKAITFEYNWTPHFPESVLLNQLRSTRQRLGL
jgi:hypothetical protein